MKKDMRKEAEAFIDKVVAPVRRVQSPDLKAARAKLDTQGLDLARRELVAAGLDPQRLDKLAAERSTQRKKLAEEGRRKAVDASAAVARHLTDIAPIIVPIDPLDMVINEVTFIRGYAGQGRRGEWNIGPGDNWAKYQLKSGTDDASLPGRLSFFTLWQNRRDTPTTVMAKPTLKVNAHLSCDVDGNGVGSWFGVTSQAKAIVRARTIIWNMDSSISSIVHDEVLGSVVARGNFWGDDSSQSIAFNEILQASGVSIAPQAYSLIEVELLTEWQVLHGSLEFDAEGGSYRVDVPQLLLSVLQTAEPPPQPPISLVATVSHATNPATITLNWTGVTGIQVDIYQDGVRIQMGPNDGEETFARAAGTYVFRVCDKGTDVCSNDVSVTVT